MNKTKDFRRSGRGVHRCNQRSGVAAAEMAIIAPILLLLLLGTIDVGQALDVWNKIDNASREGARVAARATTTATSDVDARVTTYLANAFPHVSASELASGLTVDIRDNAGVVVTDMSTVPTGDPFTVEVTIDYDTVRWMSGMQVFSKQDVTTTTQMRRE